MLYKSQREALDHLDPLRILKIKILKNKSQISFGNNAKVLPKRFLLNGHTIGFHPQTQKLELHYMSP